MRISVIIPTYNRALSVTRAIDSVLSQTQTPHELIIVDDGSSDGTITKLREKYLDRIILLSNDKNEGVSYARNRGVEVSTGDWIAFLDSDDIWDKNKLKRQIEFHKARPNLRISQSDEIWIRNGKRVNPKFKHAKKSGWIFNDSLRLCIISPSAVILERSLFNEVGQFDETLQACEDYDLWLRITKTEEIGLLNEFLMTRYGGHEDQLSSKYWGMDRFRVYAMEKHLSSSLPPESLEIFVKEYINKCEILIKGAQKHGNKDLEIFYKNKVKQVKCDTQLYF